MKKVVHKDTDDLHRKLSDALDRCKWRRMIRGKRSDRCSDDSDAES